MNPLKFIDQIKDMYNDQDPGSTIPGPRNMYQDGQLVTPSIDGSRPGYGGKDAIKKATEKKYKDFVKAFKKKNNRAPSQFEIRTQITGGGDWESIHKYLEEGKDFLTKSESLKIAQPAKTLIEDMPKGMSQWMKSNNIEVDWTGVNNQERAKLKKRFVNRNNPYFKKIEQKNKFESYIDNLISKGETGSLDKDLSTLIKDSKANISNDVGQVVLTKKNFFTKGTPKEKVFPKLEKRAIELLNEGLSAPEVTNTLQDEGVINKLNTSSQKRTFTTYYQKLLDDKKLNVSKIAETIPGLQIPKAEREMIHNAILDYMKKNPDVDSATDIAKAVTVDIDRKISGAFVENSLERAGLNPNELFKNRAERIFDDVKVLDKVIKNNQKLLNDPNVSFAEKNRLLTKLYANETDKPLKIATGEFITRLRKLGQLYTGQPQRFATELYNKIKIPSKYINSDFQKNFIGLTDAAGNLGVVDKAKLLGLPQKEIKLLSELSGAVSKLGNFKMAGDHTDIDALMKNFSNYRKNFTRIEFVKNTLNDFKGKHYDNKVLSLFNAAKKGQTHTLIDGKKIPIMQALKNLQADFFKKTGHRLGGFELSATGEINIKPQTQRIPDLKHPINTKLRETLKGLATYKLPGGKPTEITNAFDVAMQNAATVKDRINIFKKYRGTSELANSRYVKALGSVPRLKKLIKPLIAGTIGAAGVTTLSQAAGTGTAEKAASWPIEHPWLTGGGAAAVAATTKKGKDLLGKGFRTLGTKAMGPLWATSIVGENLKSGKGVAESFLDPWVGAVLLGTGTDVSKITKRPALRKLLDLGYKIPGTAWKAKNVTSPIGWGILGTELAKKVAKDSRPNYYIDPETQEPTFYKREKAADVLPTMLDIYEQAQNIAKEKGIPYQEALSQVNFERFGKLNMADGGRAGYMGGGIAAIRKPHAIPPERGGLRSIMINVNDD